MKIARGWLRKRGNVYWAFWKSDGKRFQISTKCTDEKSATAKLTELTAPFALGNQAEVARAVAVRAERMEDEAATGGKVLLLRDAWNEYLSSQSRPDSGAATLAQYVVQWERFVTWMQEHRPKAKAVRDVTAADAATFVASLKAAGRSPGTVNKYIALLRLVFRVLRKPAHLSANPFDDVRRLRDVVHSRRELTIEELRKVCSSATGDLRVMLALGMYTGLRLGDVATLRWGEVDLARKIIRRVPRKTARRSGKPVLIPIYPDLQRVLEEIEGAHGEYVLPTTAEDYLANRTRITGRVQSHFKACGISTAMPAAAVVSGKRGEVPRCRVAVEVGFHSLRHSFVSLCRAAGAPLSVVESIVGHSSPAMTRHYTHTGEEASAAAIASLPRMEEPKAALSLPSPTPAAAGGGPAVPTGAVTPATPTIEALQRVIAEAGRIVAEITAQTWEEKTAALRKLLVP